VDNSLRPFRSLRRPARELLRALIDLVFPPSCGACGAPGRGLCGVCARNLQRRPELGCGRCGEPVLAEGAACGEDHGDLRHIVRLVAPLRYAGTGGALVRRFKLDADAGAGLLLVRAMARQWSLACGSDWHRALMIPVPLHRRRRRERGFDQARWLVRRLAPRLTVQAEEGLLVRCRDTTPQGDPRVLSRTANIEGAFTLSRPQRIVDRRVILVDDVFTSGATARACASLLRQAGARDVAVLVACRS
jgi:ComF family protein